MTQTLARYAMTAPQLGQYLELMIEERKPIMLWGPPGVGKSQICQQISEKSEPTMLMSEP